MIIKDQMSPLCVQMFYQSPSNSPGQRREGRSKTVNGSSLPEIDLFLVLPSRINRMGSKDRKESQLWKYRFSHFCIPEFYGQKYYNHYKDKAELRHQKRPLIKAWLETFSTLEKKKASVLEGILDHRKVYRQKERSGMIPLCCVDESFGDTCTSWQKNAVEWQYVTLWTLSWCSRKHGSVVCIQDSQYCNESTGGKKYL